VRKELIVFGLFVFLLGYWLAASQTHISFFRKSTGESIIYVSGKKSFITIAVQDRKPKQILYIKD